MTNSNTRFKNHNPSLKFLLLGSERVGKTSLARRFLGQKFNPLYYATIGVNISSIVLDKSDEESYNILFWDMAGSDKFENLRSMYFEGASCVFLVVDITQDINIDSLLHWFEKLKEGSLKNLSVALLFNKIDLLQNEKKDTHEIAKSVRNKLLEKLPVWNIIPFETSAKTGTGVLRALFWLVDEAIFHYKKKRDFWESIFDPVNYPFALFKLSEYGCEPVFHQVERLAHVDSDNITTYLFQLGIKLSVITGQGEVYTTGVNDIAEGTGDLYRLFVYSFRLTDNEVEDPRLKNNFLQFVIFVPMMLYNYFPAFNKIRNILDSFFSEFESLQDIMLDDLIVLRTNILDHVYDEIAN